MKKKYKILASSNLENYNFVPYNYRNNCNLVPTNQNFFSPFSALKSQTLLATIIVLYVQDQPVSLFLFSNGTIIFFSVSVSNISLLTHMSLH